MSDLTTTDKPWKAIFLEDLRNHGVVTAAAIKADISRWTVYNERKLDPQFSVEWDAALDMGLDALEDAAKQRAFTVSDTLAIFLLKAHRPEKYRERYDVKHSGALTLDKAREMTDDELDEELKRRGLLAS